MSFLESIKEATVKFSEIKTPIHVISHLDTDGLTAAAIMVKTLTKLNKTFSLSIVRQMTKQFLNELKNESYENYIFLDLGSENLKDIDEVLKNRKIFILDHHLIHEHENNFYHLNPYLHNLDGSKEVSGAGVTYLFSKALDHQNKDLAYLALMGAIGDKQEAKEGFQGLNKEILKDSLDLNKIEIKTGLRMFDSQTKPLYQVLQFSTDPYLPGITGSENSSIGFLEEIGIEKNRKLIHLSEEELKKLTSSIIIKRMGSEDDPKDILGNIYLLKDQDESSPIKDLKEFSTLLNSCGRLNKPSLGIGTCLNDEKSFELAIDLLTNYKTELINSLNWFYQNKNSSSVKEIPGLTIINAEGNIRDTVIGNVTSIIGRSNAYPPDTILISLAHTLEGDTKISIRASGNKAPLINLREKLNKITQKLGYESGGHSFAAGSLMPQEKEQEFINLALESIKAPTESFITPTKPN
ncbi:MAG: hypothetical protein CMH64_04040 [Nanoarchaeota archaeon]|nr:hypothetical protein [Nanoarchaeota archaeon]|tara:strand:- start:1222 stop:2619 length:1398 start_codon:yes stop_codon:yes gene_type:complete